MNTVRNSAPGADFIVEIDRRNNVTFYTPNSQEAYEWSHGTPPGSEHPRKGNLTEGTVLFGRSFMFSNDNPRANKLRGFLKSDKLATQLGREKPFVVVTRQL